MKMMLQMKLQQMIWIVLQKVELKKDDEREVENQEKVVKKVKAKVLNEDIKINTNIFYYIFYLSL